MITHNQALKANIFDIQGWSVHDGPGCRTLIFMSGCSLNCFWCSNPEGINFNSSPLYFHSNCILCGNCAKNCPSDAIKLNDNTIIISREKCSSCENKSCVSECYTNALRLSASEFSISKLIGIIQRDRQYWGSDGGVTLTGGEPLLQIDFVENFLKTCYNSYIHTAIETSGNIPWDNFTRVIPYLDWIFFDIKNINSLKHNKATGAGNKLILENAEKLTSEYKGRLIFRLPLIPNFNDDETNINDTIVFLNKVGKNEINILPLHHLGREKYNLLNQEYLASNNPSPTSEMLYKIKNLFISAGINCYIGSETPF